MNKDRIKLSPDYGLYEHMQREGQLHIVTVRKDGEIIGYHISIVKPHLHYKESLSGFTDVFFVHPEHRRGRVGLRMFEEVEKTLKARGVEKLFGATKLHLDIGKLYERLGWVETERLFTKFIGEKSWQQQ